MKTIIFITTALLLLQLGSALDIGVTPSGMNEQQLLPGSIVEKEFFISRYDNLSKTMVSVSTQGNASEWLSIELEKEVMEGEEREMRMHVTIIVPEQVPLGEYEAIVQVKAKMENEKGTINTELAIPIAFQLNVIDEEVKKYSVVGITVDEHVEATPLPLLFTVINKGNVPATLTGANITILDKYKKITIDTYSTGIEESVRPFSREELIIEVPTTLPQDQYWAIVTLYENDDVKAQEEIIFDVQKRLDDQEKGGITLWNVAIVLLAGIILTKIVINRRKRRL